MSPELTKPLFAGAAGLALAIGAFACGGAADDPTQPVDNSGQAADNGGQATAASPQERVDGFQIFPQSPNLLPPIILPPPITLGPPPDGGVALPPFTFPPPPDGGLFPFPPITLPGLPPITLPGLPPITLLGPPPDGGISLLPLPSFPGH